MINEFKANYRFLSNFSISPFIVEINGVNVEFKSVEHYFQAMKATNKNDFMKIVNASTPSVAKKIGRQIKCRTDWEYIKDNVMKFGLSKKFEIPNFKKRLLETGNQELIEGNRWGDKYWGVDLDTAEGKNRLGELLMELRTETFNSNQDGGVP